MYSITFSPKALKQLTKLPVDVQERINGVLDRMRIRPHSFAKALVGTKNHALRAGNYRIIIEIIQNELHILVLEIGKRDKIYD